jgi:uncharacterized protein YeeX (DUF496 family)
MTTINVRLTEKEKAVLEKYGKISDLVRDAIHMYINNKKSTEALRKLKEYQKKNYVTTSVEEIVTMLREDRDSH